MDIEAMKRYPLEDFLARLGHHPVQRRANAIWYRSPYREEHTPSFKVNPEKNLWFDFGEGKGGNIFALAGSSSKAATSSHRRGMWRRWRTCRCRTMSNAAPRSAATSRTQLRGRGSAALAEPGVTPLPARKGIPSAIAIANCKEMRYSTHGKRYFAVAFGNCGGGYEIRNPFFKGCVPPKDVTLLPSGSAVCNVYEGFVDYLSARALGIGGGEDHLVLNSVSNVARAYRHLDGYGTVRCHLDNDEAGRRTLEALRTRYGGCRTAPASTADART